MTDSMVERIARAICENAGHVNDRHWKHYTIAAKAAIEAMREPTDAMLRAAYKEQDDSAIHNYGAAPTFDDYWACAIDAAFNE